MQKCNSPHGGLVHYTDAAAGASDNCRCLQLSRKLLKLIDVVVQITCSTSVSLETDVSFGRSL